MYLIFNTFKEFILWTGLLTTKNFSSRSKSHKDHHENGGDLAVTTCWRLLQAVNTKEHLEHTF